MIHNSQLHVCIKINVKKKRYLRENSVLLRDLTMMARKVINILIIILLTVPTGMYAACMETVVGSKSVAYNELLRDTVKVKRKAKKVKRGNIKKVTFESFDENYARALRFYNNKQYLSAAGVFEELYPLSLGTPRADTILYLFSECYYKNSDYLMAALHFRDYVRRYPRSDRSEEAFYYCISSIYHTCPEYSLDQSNTDYAIEQIKAFLDAYPSSSHVEECNMMLDDLRLKLARKDLEILKLYYHTDHYAACQIAAKNFFNEYSYSSLMPEAIYYLILNNYKFARKSVEKKKKERYQACKDACLKMQLDYSDSRYNKESIKIVQEVDKELEKYNHN